MPRLLPNSIRIKQRHRIPSRAERYSALSLSPAVINSYVSFVRVSLDELRGILRELFTDDILTRALRQDAIIPDFLRERFGIADLRFAELFERKGALLDRAYSAGLSIENLTNDQWRKLVGGVAIKPDPIRVAKFAEHNVGMIKSVAAKQINEVQALVQNAITYGVHPDKLSVEIDQRFNVGKSRASLIARDQVLKFHANRVQENQTKAGVTRYIWTTSNDERVREEHGELEGQEFSWDNPPVTSEDGRNNHPGEDYQCRCIPYPVIEWLDVSEWGSSELVSNVNIPRVA